jgi:hypothetical protein
MTCSGLGLSLSIRGFNGDKLALDFARGGAAEKVAFLGRAVVISPADSAAAIGGENGWTGAVFRKTVEVAVENSDQV